VGSESSATRHKLLDTVERMMLEDGYAAVTYRALATRAGVTPGLVQYYFPTLDELFVATIRRRSQQNLDRLRAALDGRDHPLKVLWDYSNNEATAALTTEFMALGNHRKSIRSAISEFTLEVRKLQFDVLAGHADDVWTLELSREALLFLVTAVPKMLLLEEDVDIDAGHREIVRAIEARLADLEPPA
jgi:AcrR family transcriptional regulator